MTSPLAPAAPAPTPTAASPAATDAPGGGERFASALDDAVAGGQGGPRGQEPAAEGEGTPAEPTAEVPAGEQPVTGPGVSPAGMPPALWVLLTGIGPGAAAPVALDGAAPVAPDASPPVVPAGDAAPAAGAVPTLPTLPMLPTLPTVAGSVAGVLPTVAGTAGPVAAPPVDGLPSSAVPGAATTTVPVSGQITQQVAVLRTAPDGTHTMTVVLTPETLGPVEVQVTLTQGSVELTLKSATEAGRSALLEALPDLRRDLAGAGLTCTNASVDRDPGGSWASAQQHAAGDRAGQHGQPDGRGRPWLRGTDVDAGRSAPVPSTAVPSSGLDVRV